MNWLKQLVLITGLPLIGCGAAAKPVDVTVELGMTLEQLRAGSTYAFSKEQAEGRGLAWPIRQPYNLTYIYKNRRLFKRYIGGAYFMATIFLDTDRRFVESVHLTYQNRPLSLDEAIAETQKLRQWFVDAGFKQSPKWNSEDASSEFSVAIRNGTEYAKPITSMAEARTALLDKDSRIVELNVVGLDTEDVGMVVMLSNARRTSEPSEGSDESDSETEEVYGVNVDIVLRSEDKTKGRAKTPLSKLDKQEISCHRLPPQIGIPAPLKRSGRRTLLPALRVTKPVLSCVEGVTL